MEPWKRASPKLNTPPSEATSQYPCPVAVASIATMGACSTPWGSPASAAAPNASTDELNSCRHGASCSAVAFAVALVVVHVASNSHGATHVTTRHTIGPTHASS